ncbi:fimbrial protein [Acinetobacter calcoaceticus]|uniref:Fimbrial protein n=1 Tax=Acinetobacter calcoaceticus TaxID=471 RepID=A0A4R1XKH4_ACICA|nr:fimbrial protein [Acinetobacter calcoaceticus]
MHCNVLVFATLFSVLGISTQLQANCVRTSVASPKEERSVFMNFGPINMHSQYLQPAGSVLGSLVVPPTAYTYGGANANSVLWICDEADLPYIHFLVANNGDDRVGGFWETGALDGLSNVYATVWEYVGIKVSMNGLPLSRIWQKLPLSSYERVNGKIQIRLMDIPSLEATLYKISNLPPANGHASNFCNYMLSSGKYTCNQPNAYIQLSGEARVSFGFNRDYAGEDSSKRYEFWGGDNGISYALLHSGPLNKTQSCAVRNVSPSVHFAPLTDLQLQQGMQAQANVSVEVECSNQAVSGVAINQTALSFQASAGAYTAADNLGLVQQNATTRYLLSDLYQSDNEIAQGVGITLKNANNNKEVLFTNPWNPAVGGEAVGWYPVLDGNPGQIGSKQSDYSSYVQSYTATLQALPGAKISAGKVKATATVVVRVQ